MNTKFHFVANYIYRQICHVVTLISRWHLTPGVLFDLRSHMMLYEFNVQYGFNGFICFS